MDARDESADADFVALLTAVQLPLLVYVRSLLPGELAAREVAQQTNARIWEMRGEFETGTNFKAWVFQIARYEVLSYRKRAARDSRLVFSGELEHTLAEELTAPAEETLLRQDALRECLGKLKSEDRELLMHRYGSGQTLSEYAAVVGRSVGGLKVTLHRLRTTLLHCIQRNLRSGKVPS